MDQNTTLTDDLKRQIYNILSQDLMDGLEKGELLVPDSEESSKFLLDELETAEKEEDALLVVQTLATRWPAYQRGYFKLKDILSKKQDTKQIDNIEEKLKQLSN